MARVRKCKGCGESSDRQFCPNCGNMLTEKAEEESFSFESKAGEAKSQNEKSYTPTYVTEEVAESYTLAEKAEEVKQEQEQPNQTTEDLWKEYGEKESDRQAPQKEKKGGNAARVMAIITIIVFALLFTFGYSYIYDYIGGGTGDMDVNAETVSNGYTEYEDVSIFEKLMIKVKVFDVNTDDGMIDCSIDTYENDEGISESAVTVVNTGDKFFSGKVKITSTKASDTKILDLKYLAPQDYYTFYFNFSKEPGIFEVTEGSLYGFSYPNADVDYEYYYDWDEEAGETWVNVLVDEENIDKSDIEKLSKYMYAYFAVTAQADDILMYFYNNQGEYEMYEGVPYPSTQQAVAATFLLYSEKKAVVFDELVEGAPISEPVEIDFSTGNGQ